ncbi:hypothetical protein ODJ79_33215 [Actinoplanes sp. KI2]|uniref:hypothetical protein n=1 Tax=Actinoplanes sp. KI2 TaxID=2983315 RepID=UPI0021D59574|nr:hypothetical protein [Actinoplanes sp. KI2]MCU7728599.1 hypothetical protein [Actinoplanes sp. KI2]
MSSEIDLLRSLDPEPPTPSTVDITRAIAAGRKRRLRRGVGYAGVAAVTTLAIAGAAVAVGQHGKTTKQPTTVAASPKPSASKVPKGNYTIPSTPNWGTVEAIPPTSCTIEKLPVPDGVRMALVSGGDPGGSWFVGRSYPKGGGYQAVIWHAGTATKVMLPGDLEENLVDVTANGDAVGWSYVQSGADGVKRPYAYVGRKIVQLKGVATGAANAINEAGAIAGEGGANPGTGRDQAVVWPSATAAPIVLPVPKGTAESTASDIDEDGTVVGSLDLKVPYVWFADGTYRALPLPTINGKKAVSARVFSIRNGWATGVADATSQDLAGANPGDGVAVRWNVRTGEVRLDDRGWDDMVDATNAQGWAVGMIKGRATYVAGDHKIVLPEVAKHDAGTLSTIANTLSDNGKVIGGQSDDASDTIRAVVWHCQ